MQNHSRRDSSRRSATAVGVILLVLVLAWPAPAQPLTSPLNQRPDWLRRDGIVMAGSWEPLSFRVRRDGSSGFTPTDEQRAAYLREHSPEMIARLKDLGVNFLMIHCYKGAGLQAERESMSDAAKFAKLCHEAGLRVGVYNYSGAFLWEPLFREVPQAKDWVLLDEKGKPRTYGGAAYRYFWNRNHPGAQAFYRQLISFAVHEIGADLLHFDNYEVGPGYDKNSIQRFRQYLRTRFTRERLEEMGAANVDAVQPPRAGPSGDLLRRAWLDFCCQSLADSYRDMSLYARGLRQDILIECNPGGPGDRITPPVDHGRLLSAGEAFWDEGRRPGYRSGQLSTRIRTYKVARRMDNMAFAYTISPLEMAESMAFNLDCLGCICWFEYAQVVALPGSQEPLSAALAPFVKFYRARRDLLREAEVVADVAVLRSFPSQVFADRKDAALTYRAEQSLIENHIPFQIIYDQHLNDLRRYRVLVLAGCEAMSDEQIGYVERYARSGGKICLVGPAGRHNEWMRPRKGPAWAGLSGSGIDRIGEDDDVAPAVRRLCGADLSLSVRAPSGVCTELTQQPGKRLLHLVDYRVGEPARDIGVSLRLPASRSRGVKSVTFASPLLVDDVRLPFEVREGRVEFTVPSVDVYGIVVVTSE
ncbi:MAG: hypothetical protein M1376_22870 [Planctomycetes bacterium]|nr:hypothetical protein [Planctomycetota bacterium]